MMEKEEKSFEIDTVQEVEAGVKDERRALGGYFGVNPAVRQPIGPGF